MTVHYYGIANCDFNYLDGAPVLIAPPDNDTERLSQTGFEQQPDGRWVHFLTAEEYDYINHSSDPAVFGKPPECLTRPLILTVIARVCYGLSAFIPLLLYFCKFSARMALLTGLALLIAGLIVMITARVRYPEHTRKATIRYIFDAIIMILLYIMIIMPLMACNELWQSCKGRCSTSNPESSGTSEVEQPPVSGYYIPKS